MQRVATALGVYCSRCRFGYEPPELLRRRPRLAAEVACYRPGKRHAHQWELSEHDLNVEADPSEWQISNQSSHYWSEGGFPPMRGDGLRTAKMLATALQFGHWRGLTNPESEENGDCESYGKAYRDEKAAGLAGAVPLLPPPY